jgi:cytochrome P450
MSVDVTDRPLFTLTDDEPAVVLGVYGRLRAEAPVAYNESLGGFWALTRYADVRAAAADAATFISSVKAVVPSDPRGIRRPPLNFDAPRHTPFRRALTRTLAPARLADLVAALYPRAAAFFDEFADGDDRDIARTFGTILPAYAEAIWLNLEGDRVEWLAQTATMWVDAWRRQDGAEVTRHSEAMYDTARWLVADRKTAPRDPASDPASALLSERVDGEPLADDLIVGALRQSLVVGMVAPPLLIGGIAAHLAGDPGLHAAIAAGQVGIDAATEEFVRLYTPYRGFARTVSAPTTIHGTLVNPGEPVTLAYVSANRDPDVFADPDVFRADRPNIDKHLGFGIGSHQCVGQHLARGIVSSAVAAMTRGSRRLELLGAPVPTRMPELGYQSVRIAVVR